MLQVGTPVALYPGVTNNSLTKEKPMKTKTNLKAGLKPIGAPIRFRKFFKLY